jgi:RNA polymerase sigma-70 factor (ECF subfamily)
MLALYLSMIDGMDDRDKFMLIYENHDSYLHSYAFSILGDKQLSEDAVQECYLRVVKNLHKINDPTCHETRSFLVIILKNAAIDIMRKRSMETFFPEDAEIAAPPDKGFETAEQFLTEFIRNLPDIYKDVVYLKYNHNCSNVQAAKLLGISPELVRKRLQRVREMLKKFENGKGRSFK